MSFLQRRRARFLVERGQPFADEELVAVANFTWVGNSTGAQPGVRGREDWAGGLPDCYVTVPRLHLGAQLTASAVDPNTHVELQLDRDRLAAANVALQRRLDEHDRLIEVLQEDLAASRQSHADDIVRLTADTTSPVAVIRHQS